VLLLCHWRCGPKEGQPAAAVPATALTKVHTKGLPLPSRLADEAQSHCELDRSKSEPGSIEQGQPPTERFYHPTERAVPRCPRNNRELAFSLHAHLAAAEPKHLVQQALVGELGGHGGGQVQGAVQQDERVDAAGACSEGQPVTLKTPGQQLITQSNG